MASPQKEKGYTAIANEIMEALVRTKINSDCWKLVLFVLRKTYGFQKKEDKISLSQFVLATQLKKSVVCRGLNRLNNMNIIIRIANDNCTIYRFNKDFDTWKPLAKLLTLAKQQTTVSQTANKALAKQRHTKETIQKKLLQKKLYSGQSPRQIEAIFEIFSKINPSLNYGNKTNRKACEEMIDKFSFEETKRMAEAVVAIQGKQYSPVATTPYQMKEKLAQFKIYFDRERNKKPNFAKI